MSITKASRGLTLSVILATHLSASIANAQPDHQSGQRRGPPPQAIEACEDQVAGAVCAFSGRRGDVSGTCISPPDGQGELACAPEGGPPRGHVEQ